MPRLQKTHNVSIDVALHNFALYKKRKALEEKIVHTGLSNKIIIILQGMVFAFLASCLYFAGLRVGTATFELVLALLLPANLSKILSSILVPLVLALASTYAWHRFTRTDLPNRPREPSEAVLGATFQFLCRVRPLTQDKLPILITWEEDEEHHDSLHTTLTLRSGATWTFAVQESPQHLQMNIGQDNYTSTRQSATLTRDGKAWRNEQGQQVTVAHTAAMLTGRVLRAGIHGVGSGVYVHKKQPTVHAYEPETDMLQSAALSQEAAPITKIASVDTHHTKRIAGLLFFALVIYNIVVLSTAGLGSIHGMEGDLAWFCIELAWIMFLCLASVVYLRKDNILHAITNARPLTRTIEPLQKLASHLTLHGTILRLEEQSLDLSQPFHMNLYHCPAIDGQASVVIDLTPHKERQTEDRLRFGVLLHPEADHGALACLEVRSAHFDETFFLDHLWPALAYWSQVHGQHVGLDFSQETTHSSTTQQASTVAITSRS